MNLNSMIDDIEEGEIVSASSDSDVPNKPICAKRKSLPRRYGLEKNKKLPSKHKRKCKHSHRHVKKAKLKMALEKPKYRKEQKIGFKQFPINNSVKKIAPRKSPNVKKTEIYSNSLYSEISNTLSKDYDKKVNKSVLHTTIPNCSSLNMTDSSKLPDGYNNCNDNSERNCVSNKNLNTSVPSTASVNSDELVDENEKLKEILSTSNFSPLSVESERKAEESEDEDELRRIALSTCAKKSPSQNNIVKEVHICSVDANHTPLIEVQPVRDNYEIVDMELDDNYGPVDDVNNLFIIDTEPVVLDEIKNVEEDNAKHVAATPADEEFEEELLRAMLIANLNSQRKNHEEVVVEKEMLKDNKKNSECISKPNLINNLPLLNRKSKPVTLQTKKINTKVKCPPRTQPNNIIHMPQNRIIISLADESSSEESDAEVENNGPVPVTTPSASNLEALICSARIKSDQPKTDVENNVSCLSKAQQEQYNLYKKILSASEGEQELVNRNDDIHLANYQLKLKEKKLSIAFTNCMKEKKLMSNEKEECISKKAAFLNMRSKAQQLREELIKTKEMMKTNFQLYQKSLNHFKTLKKSVMKREELICNLKAECTKLGVSIKGENYVLPSVSDQTPSLLDKTNSR